MHIEPTKGNKEQAEAYITKQPPFDEKGEEIICISRHGEIKGKQGQRKDLEILEELIENGLTPNEIFDLSLSYRRYEKLIKEAYYRKRYKETPVKRDVIVYWHVGKSGVGKSHASVLLAEEYGEDSIYRVSDYQNGFMDKFNGEPILFMDELKPDYGGIKYAQLLIILDVYKSQVHARYSNIVALWNEVHITSIYSPEALYQGMIEINKNIDTYEQLRRRINFIVYHFKHEDKYYTYQIPMSEYFDYDFLKTQAYEKYNLESPTTKIFNQQSMEQGAEDEKE